VFSSLAQLMRYHCPAAVCCIEATSVPLGFALEDVLRSVCGGPVGLANFLLTPQQEGADQALLLFCDLVIMEEEAMLLLFSAVVLLREVLPSPGCSFEQLKEYIRGPSGLGSLGAGGPAGVFQCVAAARALFEATPVSLSCALAQGTRAIARLSLPICAVAPDEVLHHVYERPSGSWRLVVVDVRTRSCSRALPLCMRFEPSQHSQWRPNLRNLPFEESFHLCLMGDGPAIPGDEAFELCRYLVCSQGGNAQCAHVSLVDGGWPALEELADTLRLHLMPLDPEEGEACRKAGLKQAREKVAGQVASAKESVAVAGQKVAKRVIKDLKGAGRALKKLADQPNSTGTENREATEAARI